MSFFNSIGSFFALITQFIETAFNGFIQFIEVVMIALALPRVLSGFIMPILFSSMFIFISVYVIKLIFGR